VLLDDPKPLLVLSVAGCGGGPLLCRLDRGLGRCRDRRLREIDERDDDDRDEHDSEDPSASNDGLFFLSSFGTNLVYFLGGLGAGGIVARLTFLRWLKRAINPQMCRVVSTTWINDGL
jgi:hypothetical protein